MVSRMMNRRAFLKGVGLGVCSTAVSRGFGGLPLLAAGAGRRRPNVLFIAIDDLNDWVGCLGGHPDTKTPNLDRLAARGVLFTNAHCAAPACNPSRAALMTGIRPSTSGVYHNPQPWRRSRVLRDAVTLPQHFMAHGYHASGSGKVYHGAFPDPASWEEYWPSLTQQQPGSPVPANRPLNGIPKVGHFDWGPMDVDKTAMGDWKVTDWVCGQLRRRHEKPFFLACGIYRPHLPWYVPREYFERFPLETVTLPNVNESDLDDVPEAGRKMARLGDHKRVTEHHQWRRAVQAYLASIAFADECVGKVLDALDASPYADNTIIVLWSDHGWHLGEKLHWRKFALWEEATHNVLMVVAPGVTTPGQRCDRAVSLLDIYPTLIDLCGLSPRAGLEGTSLMPLLKDPKAPREQPAVTTFGRNNHSVRDERWRLIRYADGSEELYDHQVDPLEWKNLAGDATYASVKARLAKWLPTVNVEEDPPMRRIRKPAAPRKKKSGA